jgi:hypothetical protein
MKRAVLILTLAAALLAATANARLGWTLDECKKLYGPVVKDLPLWQGLARDYFFQFGKVTVRVEIFEDKVYEIQYDMEYDGFKMNEAMGLLQKNNSGLWKENVEDRDETGMIWYIGADKDDPDIDAELDYHIKSQKTFREIDIKDWKVIKAIKAKVKQQRDDNVNAL